MYCTRCGTYNSDELIFCTNCSTQLVKPGESTRPTRTTPTAYQPPPDQTHQPYPGYRSAYSGVQGYQPYESSYANQIAAQSGSASGRAIMALILSILSLVFCGPLTSIPAIILGKMEIDAIRDGYAPKAGETLAKIGYYLGLGVTALYTLFFLVLIVIGLISVFANVN